MFFRFKLKSNDLLDSYEKIDKNQINTDVNKILNYSESTAATPLPAKHLRNKVGITSTCRNSLCQSGGSALQLSRVCFTCGLTFCHACTSYKRTLNESRTMDPLNGTPRYLCALCFAKYNSKQESGTITDRLEMIKYIRDIKKFRVNTFVDLTTQTIGSEPVRSKNICKTIYFDVEKELRRMCDGFDNAKNSWMPSSINDAVSQAKIPSWQHGCYYQTNSESKSCFNCLTSFSILAGNRHHCRLCGRLFCSECTNVELMVYNTTKKGGKSNWAINGKEGCPEEQPAVYNLYRICMGCQLLAENLILLRKEHQLVRQETQDIDTFLTDISLLHAQIYTHKLFIQSNLFGFQDLMNLTDVDKYKQDFLSNIARQKMDLSENFTSFALHMQKLPKLDPLTNRQEKLASNVSRAFTTFYMEHMNLFRELCRAMNELIPLELAKQLYIEDAFYTMNEFYTNFRQLCLEVLYISTEYKILKHLNYKLKDLNDVVEGELQILVINRKLDWVKQKDKITTKVKENFKKQPILFKGRNSVYTEDVMYKLFKDVINGYIRKLETRTTRNDFISTKKVLESLLI